MRSVTEQAALDEFLSTAELAGTDFTAEKMHAVKIIHADQGNPYLLSARDERATIKRQQAYTDRLTVPRRPSWDSTTTPFELDRRERESLLAWRRGLAELQEQQDLLLTPFERNIEVWRQLWRVVERSDVVVQIVDARNPLLFRSEDLERYVSEVDTRKENLLLINKADLLTLKQREAWAAYLKNEGLKFRFFSARLAGEEGLEDEEDFVSEDDSGDNSDGDEEGNERGGANDQDAGEEEEAPEHATSQVIDHEQAPEEDQTLAQDLDTLDDAKTQPTESTDTRILTVAELEDLFLATAPSPNISSETHSSHPPHKTTIGLVGYPNVGKSSTINTLLGAKKVSVSATPGKTKHFQTLHLSSDILLCDCPGLVFPNFATTKAELVTAGILPIDQLREVQGPAGLVAQRIPISVFEAIYGVAVPLRPREEGGSGEPTGADFLRAYAQARGFQTTGVGLPDESRAARTVLKDYVKAKLPYCHPPPTNPPIDGREFNAEAHAEAKAAAWQRKGGRGRQTREEDEPAENDDATSLSTPGIQVPQGEKTKRLDGRFFGPPQNAGHIARSFGQRMGNSGTQKSITMTEVGERLLSGRKARTMIALERGIDVAEVNLGSKKHFKGGVRARGKQRSGGGVDD